ncbi:hypothetical protein H5410_013379 [Solanum commersonii]|uniref:Uncharacterized protein n=1 Tax=Solanum commersonii TaxID=4109 RepID=A0A9J6AUZ2_SOLCO|nr:hypothetical protein H5410_013379 [Solanum commersonii]
MSKKQIETPRKSPRFDGISTDDAHAPSFNILSQTSRLKLFKFRTPVVHLVRRIKKIKIMKQAKVRLRQIKGERRGRGKNLLKPLQSLIPTQIRILLVKQKRRKQKKQQRLKSLKHQNLIQEEKQ